MHASQNAEDVSGRGLPWTNQWAWRLLCLAWLLSAVGCFEKTYADRMQKTVRFYDHLDLLNRNLGGEWVEMGFKLRPPQGFVFIPKPVPPPPDPNDPNPMPVKEETLDDSRQPGYLGIKLPGLVAAWEKPVNVDEAGATATRKAYIYLLSNASLFSVSPEMPGRIDPLKFQDYVINLLAPDLGVQFKQEDWRQGERFPIGFDLVPSVTYHSLVLLPDRMFEDTKMTFKVFNTSQGDMQTVVLFVYPDSTSANEKLNERIGLALETLRMPASASAATAPAPGSPTATGAPAL